MSQRGLGSHRPHGTRAGLTVKKLPCTAVVVTLRSIIPVQIVRLYGLPWTPLKYVCYRERCGHFCYWMYRESNRVMHTQLELIFVSDSSKAH